MTSQPVPPATVTALRRFTRFYTGRMGVLREGLLDSTFSLTEARVLYELANRDRPTSRDLVRDLDIDAGYLSRILKRFEQQGLLQKSRSSHDGRHAHLALTDSGREAFLPLNAASGDKACELLAPLSEADRQRLVEAMALIESLLGRTPRDKAPYLLRPHRPGDMGWIVHRHGALYAQEYGWDDTFEALVAEIAAGFIKDFDPKRERCWIAESEGEIVGSVLLVGADRRGGEAPAPLCRAEGTRARHRQALRRGMHPLCPREPATAASPCGRTTSCTRRAISMRRAASRW